MKRLIAALGVGMFLTASQIAPAVDSGMLKVNEIRADDASTDDAEFIELIGLAGTNITEFQIKHYNQVGTYQWTHTVGSFTIPDDGTKDNGDNALGFYVLGCNFSGEVDESVDKGLQNGPGDIIILYDSGNSILDAIAWGSLQKGLSLETLGVDTTGNTRANNYLHVTRNDANNDNSLQAPNDVLEDDGSGWYLASATIGAINANQTSGDISLPVTLTSFTASAGDGEVSLRWVTESEVNNLGFNIYRARREKKKDERGEPKEDEYVKINPELIPGAGTSTVRHSYCFTDKNVDNGTTYFYRLEDVSLDGESTFHGPVEVVPRPAEQEEQGEEFPRQPRLDQNFPNPFNPETSIRFAVPLLRGEPAIFLEIYNLSGQKVRTLLQQSIYPGFYQLVWDSRDQNGVQVASGVYLCVLKIGGELIDTRKMALIR